MSLYLSPGSPSPHLPAPALHTLNPPTAKFPAIDQGTRAAPLSTNIFSLFLTRHIRY